ncbi:unnamed protein product [Ectocarpus sp. CCAP 1310/34]|nr:unnamed protein product [Ectocarpus sp. CCAP 1310/34]
MAARCAEVLAAVRDRGGGAAAGGAAGVAPAPGYGGARAAAGVTPAPMYGARVRVTGSTAWNRVPGCCRALVGMAVGAAWLHSRDFIAVWSGRPEHGLRGIRDGNGDVARPAADGKGDLGPAGERLELGEQPHVMFADEMQRRSDQLERLRATISEWPPTRCFASESELRGVAAGYKESESGSRLMGDAVE